MTEQDYKNKVDEMTQLSKKRNKTKSEKDMMADLALDISVYEANYGMVELTDKS